MSNLPSHLLLTGAFSDAFACLCLVQRIALSSGDKELNLQHIEVVVAETLTNLRATQEELSKCAPLSQC